MCTWAKDISILGVEAVVDPQPTVGAVDERTLISHAAHVIKPDDAHSPAKERSWEGKRIACREECQIIGCEEHRTSIVTRPEVQLVADCMH